MLGVCMHSCMLCHFSHVWLFATLWTIGHQAPLSMGFSRQEYWGVLPCLPPGNLLNLGTEPASLMFYALAAGFFTSSATWEAPCWVYTYLHTSTWTDHRYICVLPIVNTHPNCFPPYPSRLSQSTCFGCPVSAMGLALVTCFTRCDVCVSMLSSQCPTHFFSRWVPKSVPCVCVSPAALHAGSSAPSS